MASPQAQNSDGGPRIGQTPGPAQNQSPPAPAVSLPKGGGAITGIGEKFAANPVTGTASVTIPIPVSPGRSGFNPQLSLSYDSGAGNGPFGFGWSLGVARITRKTDKGIPRYRDDQESDVFILSDAEDLVPILSPNGEREILERSRDGKSHSVVRYRPRIEGLFARIERWQETQTGDMHWRVTTKDNVTSVYGDSDRSRISDPEDQRHVFSWLLARSYDDKGNLVDYEYKSEDSANISEQIHEHDRVVTANRYLKRISYGHQTPFFASGNPELPTDWHFQVVFDYGEHDLINPLVADGPAWSARPDPFSSYRSGFEVRTYRRCRRVLMFHNFAELGDSPCLVRSTDLSFLEEESDEPAASLIASFISAATQSGYVRKDGAYLKKSLPPLEFDYTKAEIDQTLRIAGPTLLENVPEGIDGSRYQWVDIDGEGASGVLMQTPGAWHYKRNLTPLSYPEEIGPRFSAAEVLELQPASAGAAPNAQQLLDLAGDGQLDVVQFDGGTPGFYERTEDERWSSFKAFNSSPNIPWGDPNLRFIDLTGDGHADILISGNEVFTWYPSLGEDGFGPGVAIRKAVAEENGPRLVFADGAQSVYLADMSGDGLSDFVRIRNGEVCYWPSMGYGRFGSKVTMSRAPLFDHPDLFDQSRIRLADIDGSGVTDIIYLGRDLIRIYFNRSGNSWTDAVVLDQMPAIDNLSSVTAMDLLGNGTACLVWSSHGPSHANRSMRYVDLMGGTKPHLLIGVRNNMGAETRMRYAPSTKFYLRDRFAGNPWITRLPFPVHVVEQVEVFDWVGKTKLSTTYSYHHGYFDGPEREFRGFGRVDQRDTESFSKYSGAGLFTEVPQTAGEEFHLPPTRTVTWFHNGAFIKQDNISRLYEAEYYKGDPLATLLPDTSLPDELTTSDISEACRALKGRLLRQEVYAEDASDESEDPYSVTEHAYQLRRVQPAADNRCPVFFTYESESLAYHYERNPADPRVSHHLTLELDDFGNVTKSAEVGYARRPSPSRMAEQARTYVTHTEARFANFPGEVDWYRVGLPVEQRTYEITGTPGADDLFTCDSIAAAVQSAAEISYETVSDDGSTQKRLIEHVRTLYRRDDLTGALALGTVESLALVYESYKLALTPGLTSEVYGDRVNVQMLEQEGGYVHTEDDDNWWIPSGHVFLSPEQSDSSVEELAVARQRFFLPHRFRDPFGNTGTLRYDDYNLLVTESRDPLGNVVGGRNHYRNLAPQMTIDPNGNRNAVRFDALGMVTATFVTGKPDRDEGDLFDETSDEISAADDPTTRLEYDLFNWTANRRPNFVHTFARELHGAANTRWQESYSFSDGLSREIEKKIQAEPGLAPARGADGALVTDAGGSLQLAPTSSRWVGTGRTVFDNKGNPVKKYEPFFDSTPEFVDEEDLVELGVTVILRYDPLGRVMRTDLPDGTFSRVEFDAWRETTYDAGDTVIESRWYSERGSPDPAGPEPSDQRARAAWLAAQHAGTPTVAHFDSLGRPYLTVVDNGLAEDGTPRRFETRVELDIEGNQRSVIDAIGRKVMQYDHDMLGTVIHQTSMDAGRRWTLANVLGKTIHRWDSRAQIFSTRYDALGRATHLFVRFEDGPERIMERTVYGEAHPDSNGACDLNLRGRVLMSLDQAGVVSSGGVISAASALEAYDFKGNLLNSVRQFEREYKQLIDWSEVDALLTPEPDAVLQLAAIAAALTPSLEPETFLHSSTFDALNRVVSLTAPDGSVVRPTFNEANLLERVTASMRGSSEVTDFVTGIDYDAKGQRREIVYGNNVVTAYDYDPLTFRLTRLRTTRAQTSLQDLSYTYDAVGNISFIRDDAQQTIFFDNQVVSASSRYTYDALYRLMRAEGREHAGQSATAQVDHDDAARMRLPLPQPNDAQALRRYVEEYEYDEVGNILAMIHRADGAGWTRKYQYAEDSNRLLRTSLPGDADAGPFSAVYDYDAHGNMVRMPHLPMMSWNSMDQMGSTSRQVVNSGTAETTYYVYDSAGERVRKITESQAAPGVEAARKNERFYLGGLEIYREYGGGGSLVSERETLHVMDDTRRIALVDTRTIDESSAGGLPETLTRFELTNHLGSATMELDDGGAVISYEEYHPYGSTSYGAGRSAVEVSFKRYRYTGKERDEETSLYYYGTRYYAAWLGRWTAADAAGLADGVNRYAYARCDPIGRIDPLGTTSIASMQERVQQAIAAAQGSKAIEPSAPPAKDTIQAVAEAAGGVQLGMAKLGAGLLLSADPVTQVALAAAAFSADREPRPQMNVADAAVVAVNEQLNPAYSGVLAAHKVGGAIEAQDYHAAGELGVDIAASAASTVMLATGAVKSGPGQRAAKAIERGLNRLGSAVRSGIIDTAFMVSGTGSFGVSGGGSGGPKGAPGSNVGLPGSQKTAVVEPDVPTHEIVPIDQIATRGGKAFAPKEGDYRGITRRMRQEAQRVGETYSGPGDYHVGHRQPLSQIPPGERVRLRSESASKNLQGAPTIVTDNELRRKAGLYVRPKK